MSNFLDEVQKRIVVFDGAMGTSIQNLDLSPDDFDGLDGCNEYLVLSKPDAIRGIHASFLDVGCQVIETDTFGATSIVLGEYDIPDKAYEINKAAAELAKDVAADYSTPDFPRFVAGSIGPGTKLPTLGHISFDDLKEAYDSQVAGLVDGGSDLLVVETCQDILQAKAVLVSIQEYFEKIGRKIPVIVQVTVETTGTLLVGSDIAAALTSLEPYNFVDFIGMNCATGPEKMSDHIRYLSANSRRPISVIPNAGIPENIGGETVYPLTPDNLATTLTHFVDDLGVNIVGGCCGTTPKHLEQLVQTVDGKAPQDREVNWSPAASSLYQSVDLTQDPPPLLVGERTNANGSKKFKRLLEKEDWEGMVEMAKEQERGGAHILDVCAAYVGRDEVRDMNEIIPRFNKQVTIPLMIDSTEWEVIEESLKNISGRAIVNSINMEDGEERMANVLPLCKKYGAAVIALTIDEDGMAKTVDKKVEIAKRIYDITTDKYGLRPEDLFFDTLTFTLGSGDEEFRGAGEATIEAIRRIKEELPGVRTLLGVSNISFGLNPDARHVLNSVFLHKAIEYGLDAAIVHASKIIPMYQISEEERKLCEDLIFDNRTDDYDPLAEMMAFYEESEGSRREAEESLDEELPIEERLEKRIVDGRKQGLTDDLDEALKEYSPLHIINNFLLAGMKTVGELFGAGEMQLPFVLQSAETMKTAVAHLEPHMEKSESSQKGKIVLATVKGDVHDIGKNLVDIILTNNGYSVTNLGIKVPIDNMLESMEKEKPDAIGMSGLLVKSTIIMKENLEVMNERSVDIPVILGGAALNRRYVESDLRKTYKGPVYYGKDAFTGLNIMDDLVAEKKQKVEKAEEAELDIPEPKKISSRVKTRSIGPSLGTDKYTESDIQNDNPVPEPPFWGTKVVDDIDVDEVYPYINTIALFRAQWQYRKAGGSREEYQQMIEEEVQPEFERLQRKGKEEGLLNPRVTYGYFPCQSEKNDLIVYDPETYDKHERFTFPRQEKKQHLCLADFFRPVSSGEVDVVAFQLVTVGEKASQESQKLFENDEYKEYLLWHGFSVETAEGLAEYWHKKVREELGFGDEDADEIRDLFKQGYRGSRYSFGYPACPHLEDHEQLFRLINPATIGVELSEGYQLHPEQSTSAIVVHHPEAKYYSL
ncbi:MAG: Methionine synthase [Candidatus Marinimicrobia bacterium]|nr:Methionine synthase [Candidatus Neomarinimicrobiota bacterium]